MEEEIKIDGIVGEIIYYNDDNGYTVCVIESADEGIFTATGYMPALAQGENVVLTGVWTNHSSYGEQFKVVYYEKVLPSDEQAILTYLSSGVIKGIRKSTAKKLLETFGTEVLNIMLSEPMRLAEVKGISRDKAERIGKEFAELQCMQGIIMFLQQYNVSPSLSVKAYKILGSGAKEKIENNPYILAEEVDGISFKTSDNIAFARGMPKNNPNRLRAGIKYLLSNAAYTSGHTYMPKMILVQHCAYKLGVEEDEIANALSSLIMDSHIFFDNINGEEVCYLTGFYIDEITLARRLGSMSQSPPKYTMTAEEAEKVISDIGERTGICLADKQFDAVIASIENSVSVITGGPGTGKTTAINTIIHIMKFLELDVALAAPTGRAAKRMTEVTGIEAKTIHRLLKMNPSGDGINQVFEYNETNNLEADVIIVDEMSMVDVNLMASLIKAVKPGARLIMSGDADQLPSVGAGNVLRDIIASGIIPVTRLDKIFRQAEESLIVVNAHRINRGEYPELKTRDNNFFFMARNTADEIVGTVISLCKTRLPKSYGVNMFSDIQVLSPMKKGAAGVINLNAELQKNINPPEKGKSEYKYGQVIFRSGDRVMQTKNDYDLTWEKRKTGENGAGVFNGDMGIIKNVDARSKILTVEFDDDRTVDYEFSRLEELDLSYAVTVHKSQGSEFPIVVMPVYFCAPLLMCRNLFYTAVTRAKNMVILVGSENAVYSMVDNNTERERYSGLAERLTRFADGSYEELFDEGFNRK